MIWETEKGCVVTSCTASWECSRPDTGYKIQLRSEGAIVIDMTLPADHGFEQVRRVDLFLGEQLRDHVIKKIEFCNSCKNVIFHYHFLNRLMKLVVPQVVWAAAGSPLFKKVQE